MAFESKQNIDCRCIFRTCFNDEVTVRSQGGIPSNVTFQNGILSRISDNSYVTIPRFFNGTYTIRLIVKDFVPNGNWRYFYDFRSVSGGGAYGLDNNGVLTLGVGGGTAYINGVTSTTLTTNTKEIVVSGFSVSSAKKLTILNSFNLASSIISSIELCEIYSGTLTAQEAKALYNNSRYKTPILDHDEQVGPELCGNSTFDGDTWWEKVDASCTIADGVGHCIETPTNKGFKKIGSLVVGKIYRYSWEVKNYVKGSVAFTDSNVTFGGSKTTNGVYSGIFTATGTQMWIMTQGTSTLDIDNVSLKEVIVNRTKTILDVCACGGTIRNRLSGDIYTSELCRDPYFNNPAVWTIAGGTPSISNGVATLSPSTTINHSPAVSLVVGKTYRLKYTITSINPGSGGIQIGVGSTGSAIKRTTTGTFIEDVVCSGATLLYIFTGAGFISGTMTELSIKESVPSVILTDTSIQKESDAYNIVGNGSTTKIDCGNYDSLLGDKTFTSWVRYKSRGGSSGVAGSMIVSNGKFALLWYNSGITPVIACISDGATLIHTGAISNGIFNRWIHVVATRTSTGLTSLFLDGTLVNGANRSTGTPVAGTSNILIGNASTNNRGHHGLLGPTRIIDGLLTPEEIMNLFTAEKGRYGL